MQRLTTFLFFIALISNVRAQSGSHNIEFGIDLTGPIIIASGGQRPYNEVDFLYREAQEQGDLRFKLSISNHNYYGIEIFSSRLLDDNQPEYQTYFQAIYKPKTSYLLSIGVSRYLPQNELPVYTGLDFNVGLARGSVSTHLMEKRLGKEELQTISTQGSNFMILGITPFLGFKRELTEKILFGIEFGTGLNFVTGKLEHLDENEEVHNKSVNRLDFHLNRLINDIVLLIKL